MYCRFEAARRDSLQTGDDNVVIAGLSFSLALLGHSTLGKIVKMPFHFLFSPTKINIESFLCFSHIAECFAPPSDTNYSFYFLHYILKQKKAPEIRELLVAAVRLERTTGRV